MGVQLVAVWECQAVSVLGQVVLRKAVDVILVFEKSLIVTEVVLHSHHYTSHHVESLHLQ